MPRRSKRALGLQEPKVSGDSGSGLGKFMPMESRDSLWPEKSLQDQGRREN